MRAGVGATLALVLVLAVSAAGCSSGGSDSATSPQSGATASSAPPAPAPPRAGQCHQLDLQQATDPVDTTEPVPCTGAHTSQTYRVGKLSALADGHLLAVDSAVVQARLAKTCPAALPAYVGGDRTTQRLSRLEAVWFGPSLAEADAGADWYRCDVVGLRKEGELISLPPRLKGALGATGALDRFGTCGTAAPDAKAFQRVVCAERHAWQAVDVVDLPASTHYLAKAAGARGDAACKDVAAQRANGALTYTWSFEWPTRAQWAAGQRYGYCWVPSKR
jgi:hypothetical protein